ncbi:hypothetical protein [Chondromyces crocatus]|uniref:hypothetical protein n=1 Tax=Chondromyces crocatus TaxID=52 RepID=UPI0012E1C2B4|nr:hypothetical protein [Chondromyces crocatus]
MRRLLISPRSAWLSLAWLPLLLTSGLLSGCLSHASEAGPSDPTHEHAASSSAAQRDVDPQHRRHDTSGTPRVRASAVPASTWTACYRDFQPEGDAPTDLERLATACGAITGLSPITPVHLGAPQSADDPSARLTFRARAGHCYRFFSVGTADVADLDVAVFDADGHIVAADASDDRFPVVPPRGPLCAEDDGTYALEIAVMRGKGSFVMQVWSD